MYLSHHTNIFNCIQGYTEFEIVDIMEWVFLHTNAKKKQSCEENTLVSTAYNIKVLKKFPIEK